MDHEEHAPRRTDHMRMRYDDSSPPIPFDLVSSSILYNFIFHFFAADTYEYPILLRSIYGRLVVRYLKYNRSECKLVRSISCEHKAWGFRLVRALKWSNSPTSSIDVLCHWDWFFSLSFGIFRVFFRESFGIFRIVLGCAQCEYILSIYSRGTTS
jgi:hypothetical protein